MRSLVVVAALLVLGAGPAGASAPAHQRPSMPDAKHVASAAPTTIAYAGGNVEVTPKVYLVFWGWGDRGAFDHTTPGPANDPDGAAQRMTSFVAALGGTPWANVSTRYYEKINGQHIDVQNPRDILAGVWYDDTDPIHDNLSARELAQEAQRAVSHFDVTDLANSQFVIAQPQMFDEAGFVSSAGYCAWHDYTQPSTYPGIETGISFTNMPYVLDAGASCGENAVHSGSDGTLDGFTIVLGHEIEATIADPGAETVLNGERLGAWYDSAGDEADPCAWNVPGRLGDITGNDGKQYPVCNPSTG